MEAVEVHGLGKTFGAIRALDDVTFSIEAGQVLGLLGRNGSDKTTTVRILATLTLPSEGDARVCGFDVLANRNEVRRRIGVTMQAAALDPDMTGREHLELIAGAWGAGHATRDRAEQLLAELGLAAAADRVIATYSGGMRRRVDLAAALVNEPEVLFLDEPTTGLDAQSRRALWERVRQLRDSGTAVLLTTQYLEEADVFADQLAILDGGRIVAAGTPSGVKERHSSTVVRLRPARPAHLGAAGLTAYAEPGGWVRFEVESPAGALALVERMRAAGAEVAELSIAPPTLEEAFLALTGATTLEPPAIEPFPVTTGAAR